MSKKPTVFSDPYHELPFPSEKYSTRCEEMHLAERGIDKLKDFETFISLSVLWINNNNIDSFEGLEKNFRLKEIYAHKNRFKKLTDACLSHCTFLTKLALNDNRLDNLENVIRELKSCNHLHHLDLFNNPIAQEDNYRLRMIGELRSLHTLDRRAVTPEEKKEAKVYMKKMAKLNNFSFSKRKVVIPKYTEEEEKQRQEVYNDIVIRLREKTFKSRIALENSFVLNDKRHIGKIPADKFWDVLDIYNLTALLDDYERELITEMYTVKTRIEAITMTGTMDKEFVWYRKFCEDVLRTELRRLPDETYRMNRCLEISASTSDLMKYVKTVKMTATRREEEVKRATLMAGSASMNSTENIFSDPSSKPKNRAEQFGINEWIAGELNKIILAVSGDSFTIDQVVSIIKKMMNFNYIPALGLKGAKEAMLGKGEEKRESFSLIDLKDAFGISITPTTDMPEIRWRILNDKEQDKMTDKIFEGGLESLDNLLQTKPSDPAAQDFLAKTTNAAISGTRLQSFKKKKVMQPRWISPAMALAKAPLRADVVIIPNVLPDLEKEEREKAILDKANFESYLKDLGMKDENLQVALDRKRRGVLKTVQRKEELRKEKEEAALIALAKSMSAPNLKKGAKKKEPKEKKKRPPLVPPSDGGPKGWASSTGNVVINGRGGLPETH